MRRPNKPTKRKQRRNAFGQFARPKSNYKPETWRAGETIDQRKPKVEWERTEDWAVITNALQKGLERGQSLPEPMQALVHQPIQRTRWQRFWAFWRGK